MNWYTKYIQKKRYTEQPKKPFTRQDFINLIPKDAHVLEIGPFYSPLLKSKKVKYFDILDQKALKKRAVKINQQKNVKNIPLIDYVSPTGKLEVVKEKFDIVISSHVIEHQIDLIAHLQDVTGILNKAGLYYLLIPDKRYCFDHYINVSDLPEVVARHYENRKSHSLKSVIEHRAFTTHSDSIRHWNKDHGDASHNQRKRIDVAVEDFKKSKGRNIDVHAWYFTPKSFEELITSLKKLGYINLSVKKIYKTERNSLEFFAILE